MEHSEFRVKAKEMVDYVADYLENIRDRKVYPGVQPGYLHKLLPTEAPVLPEKWDDIVKDLDDKIMPGLVHWQSPHMHAYFTALTSYPSIMGELVSRALNLVHWQSPHMHAYFTALTSYPSIMGELVSSALNVLCFTWASSPAGTELETIVMNWLGKMLGLPEMFLNEKNDSPGGGVIQTTASEATLVSLLAARTSALIELAKLNPDLQASELLGHLICYCSDQAHSSVEKAGLIGLVRMRYIETDGNQSMRGDKLEEAIISDKAKGLVPFWVCATLGTTGTVAFDNLREIGQVCEKHSAWLHVDAAYAGSCFVCPEFRHWMDGMELADSFAFNPSKWLMVNFDCTAMWVRDSKALHRTFNVNPIYLRHENSGKAIDYMVGSQKPNKKRIIQREEINAAGIDNIELQQTDIENIELGKTGIEDDLKSKMHDDDGSDSGLFGDESDGGLYDSGNDEDIRNMYDTFNADGDKIQLEDQDKKEYLHWQIPLSRRFRALKLWFVLRNFGISGLQKHIREAVRLAQKFQALVLADPRFEVPQPSNLGLVVFRLKGDNALTERLLKRLNGRGKIHAVPASFKGIYVIRFTVTSQKTTNQDILDDWNEIRTAASELLVENFGSSDGNIAVPKRPRISLKETRDLNATFGTSLLLANSPMSPKIVNGTHAAICDYEQVITACAQTFVQLKMEPKDSPEMRRRIRGIKMSGKMYSLDSCMDLVQGLMMDQPLPGCKEDEREDASNGSSPGERSSLTSSPVASSLKQESNPDTNQLHLPPPSRPYRSKSVDVSLTGLKLDDAKITIDMKNSEIIITPTGSKTVTDDNDKKTVHFSNIEEKLNIGDKITEAFENFQDGLHMLNDFRQNDEKDKTNDCNAKLTIKGPGSYIKKLIQQFSEGPIEAEDPKPESDRAMSTQSIKERADAICKKCLHYKGKIGK